MNTLISWICNAIVYGTVIMFGALGENLTEKSGHLNLGVPGLMFLGGFAGFAAAFLYENSTENPSAVLMIILPLLAALLASAIGGMIYSFLTDVLRANQNVTGLALTAFGVGVGTFGGVYICKVAGTGTYSTVAKTSELFCANLNRLFDLGTVGKLLLSYGFLTYVAVLLAILLQRFLNRSRIGLNLRAVGENPATADAAGISVLKYRFLSTVLGAAISGLGGLYYVLVYASGGWTTQNSIEALGWLAVALVIFARWRPVHIIWGSYLFALLFWLYSYFPSLTGIKLSNSATDLLQMIPYLMTVVVLVVVSMRKKPEDQPPASLGINYFREDR